MHNAENRAGGGEIGIKLNGALQMRECVSLIESIMEAVAEAEFLEGFQRRGGGLFERRGELLHAGEGFAEFLAEVGGGFVERLENLFLACGFGLLTSEGIARLRVGGFERDGVLAAKTGDGAGEDGPCVF